jgi:predicted transcriptional regulator
MLNIMAAKLREVLEKAESWPREDQEELVDLAREIESRRNGVYQLSDDERNAIEQGLADARAGRFASDRDIDAIFEKARSPR